jgi:hypothetical protein
MLALCRTSAAVTAGLLLMVFLLSAERASATTEIEGSEHDVVLRVKNAPIKDVLDALAVRFKLSYRAPLNLTRELSGRYSGSLNQVLVRILDDVDYVVEAADDGIKLVIFNPADKATASTLAAPDNRSRNVSNPPALAAGAAAQARPDQAGGAAQNQNGATTVQPGQPASSPMARQPLAVPGTATSAAVPPLASFLPTSSLPPLP